MSDQNINNFATIIDDSKIVKIIPKNSLLAFGYINKKSISKYSPAGIQWDNLLKQIQSEISSVPSIDTNTWNLPGAAFVDPNYTVGDGTVGDGNKPFRTFEQAAAASNLVIALPGEYFGNINLVSGVLYHCMPGVIFADGSKLSDNGQAISTLITGNAVFEEGSYGIECSAVGSYIHATVEEFKGVRTVSYCTNTTGPSEIYVKATKKIYCKSNNGSGFSSRANGGSIITIETPEFITDYYGFGIGANSSGQTAKFFLRCPKVVTQSTGVYGNTQKSLISMNAFNPDGLEVDVDFMGGTYTNLAISSVDFGVPGSALINHATNYDPDPSKLKFRNGKVFSSNLPGLRSAYATAGGTFELDNIQIVSGSNALELHMTNYNGAGRETVIARNCKFEGLGFLLGNGKSVDFSNCTFKVTDATKTAIFDYMTANPNEPLIARFRQCEFELATAGSGVFMTNTIVGTDIAFLNSFSTELSLGTNVTDGWGGYAQIPTLTIKNIV
jgi:hypothetical protein